MRFLSVLIQRRSTGRLRASSKHGTYNHKRPRKNEKNRETRQQRVTNTTRTHMLLLQEESFLYIHQVLVNPSRKKKLRNDFTPVPHQTTIIQTTKSPKYKFYQTLDWQQLKHTFNEETINKNTQQQWSPVSQTSPSWACLGPLLRHHEEILRAPLSINKKNAKQPSIGTFFRFHWLFCVFFVNFIGIIFSFNFLVFG